MSTWVLLFASIAAATTWLARRYAIARNLMDEPGERRSHRTATPRGGGIAIVLALLIAVVPLALRFPADALRLGLFAIGLLLVAVVGLVDDHRPLSPWLRLAVHGLAALLLGAAVGLHAGSPWWGLLAFAAAIGLTNVWNFMDGINGIAATQAILVALAIASVASGAWAWLALTLAAACIGFLPFNFPRARIFLGDVGSGALGYSLAALIAVTIGARPPLWPVAVLPVGAFVIDASLTLVRRVARGERWWTPHTQHAYQVAARRFGHTRVTLAYGAVTAMMCVAAVPAGSAAPRVKLVLVLLGIFLLMPGWQVVQWIERQKD